MVVINVGHKWYCNDVLLSGRLSIQVILAAEVKKKEEEAVNFAEGVVLEPDVSKGWIC